MSTLIISGSSKQLKLCLSHQDVQGMKWLSWLEAFTSCFHQLNSLTSSQAEIQGEITHRKPVCSVEGWGDTPSAPANSIGIKTNRERPFYFSVTSKWEACPLTPESIFVVTMKIPQFPLFNQVLLVCVPLPVEYCCGPLPLSTTGKQIPL